MNVSQGSAKELKEQMHKPQNALMHQKTQTVVLEGVTPILTEIIRDGIEEGLFATPYPRECMEMLLLYGGTVFDDAADTSQDVREQRIRAFIFHTERLLGAESGSLTPYMLQMFGLR